MDIIVSQALNSTEKLAWLIGTFIGGGGVGLICGLLPYFIGKKRDNRKLGNFALYACLVSGLILGVILALPMAIAFTVAILASRSPSLNEKLSDGPKESVNLT
jgi:ABC-type tungstate transport system substrate-binding protein